MPSKTRETVDRDVWGPSPLRLPPPKNVKVTVRWSREPGTKVRLSTVSDDAYQFLVDLLGKDRMRNKKAQVVAETQERRRARRRERDRNWRQAKRRASGMVTRGIYERDSITKREPWKAFGWSRRTWERHGKPDVASMSSPVIPTIIPSNPRRHSCVPPRHHPEVSGNTSKARRTTQRRRHFPVGEGYGILIWRDGRWWPQRRRHRCYHATGFHRPALVPVKIIYDPNADPPIQISETREPPLYLDTSDFGKDKQSLVYETLLLSTPWLSPELRRALLKETSISRRKMAQYRTFSLWLETNKCERRLRRERDTARWGKKIKSYNGWPIVWEPVKGGPRTLAIKEVAAKHNLTPAALKGRFRRHRPSGLCPSR